MKFALTYALILVFPCSASLRAEEPDPQILGLQKTAADFVIAYNKQEAAALAELFTQDGEIADLRGDRLIAGRAAIEAHYQQIFANDPLYIAIDVNSIRFVTPTLAIEDGVCHLTPGDDETVPPKSFAYMAVLTKANDGAWQIASSRNLENRTTAAGQLAPLAKILVGDWTYSSPDGMRFDLAFGWDATGNNLIAETLTTLADAEPQNGSIRIGYDASKKQIVSWMFDGSGGFTHGRWTPVDSGWLIHSEGTTGDGETFIASQNLAQQGADALVWTSTHRVIGGESTPDVVMRLVHQAPEPEEDESETR